MSGSGSEGGAPPLLEARGLSKSFGPTRALRGAGLDLRAREIHALVGENGAGKSTLIKILAGVFPCDDGEVLLEGRAITPANPREARSLGISTVFQELSLCGNMTVAENIFVNREPVRLGLVRRREMEGRAGEFLRNFNVQLDPRDRVGDLTVAQRQIVEIVKAVSVNARVLILDEPTSSLDDRESEKLFDLLGRLRENGAGIIFVSHKLNEVFRVADRITVFRDGEQIMTSARGATAQADVIRAMVGREISQVFPPKGKKAGPPKLSFTGFSSGALFRDVALTVHGGEILGLAGLTGAGRTEVMQALFGYSPKDSGEVLREGRPVRIGTPADAIREGIMYAPEDRRLHGLFLGESVAMNVGAASLRSCSGALLMSSAKESALARQMVERLSIRVSSIEQEAGSLSGGNQQKVVLAKCLAANPAVLIVDEPTRGIDIGSKIEIYAQLRAFADRGGAVILVSSELQEIIGLSDRVVVFRGGRMTGEVGGGMNEDSIVARMFEHTHEPAAP
ncbi:MAG TPA: sugar ABC transporter ATP-binding protein [Bacteroidota bacterium]|nr:sugar ABC transporter ATP-binding protein [Bacteroidota bacterium]